MSVVMVSGGWHCQDCGDCGAVEPVEAGETIYVDHHCGSAEYPEDERW